MTTVFRFLLFIGMLGLVLHGSTTLAQNNKILAGRVLFPNGTPAPDARVTVKTDCQNAGYSLVKYAIASPDGSFFVPAFGEDCQRYRLTADKREEFWLETGEDKVFYRANGVSATLDISSDSPLQPALIVLGARGGKIDVQVWDNATNQFIYALVSIEHKPVVGKTFGSMEIATGHDGSPDTLFLPAGDYTASVEQFKCHEKLFWAIRPPVFPFTAVAGERNELKISIDAGLIEGSPGNGKCVP
jgi:hypothetical protein